MRVALKFAAAILAGTALVTQTQPLEAALVCSPMSLSVQNTKLRGIWKWATANQPAVVCTTYFNAFGQATGGPNQCVGPTQYWPTAGTLTGKIVVAPNCKVTGVLTLNAPAPAVSHTYTVDAVLQQAPTGTANIIMGPLLEGSQPFYFWMIQSTQ